jgi:single-stranded DNA-binding protein
MWNPRNHSTLEGRLVRDPEYKSEHNVLTFTIAVDNAGRKDKEYGAGFFDIVVFTSDNDFRAPAVAKNLIKHYNDKTLVKGTLVAVAGELHHRTWTDDDGKWAGTRTEIIADAVQVRYYKKEDDASGDSESAEPTKKYVADSF